MLYFILVGACIFQIYSFSAFFLEDRGSIFLQNISTHLTNYNAGFRSFATWYFIVGWVVPDALKEGGTFRVPGSSHVTIQHYIPEGWIFWSRAVTASNLATYSIISLLRRLITIVQTVFWHFTLSDQSGTTRYKGYWWRGAIWVGITKVSHWPGKL